MAKIALIESKPSNTDYFNKFDGEFEFDRFQLCSDRNVKKVYKKDVDIDINTSAYDWIILIGSDVLKYFTKATSIMDLTGKRVQDNFLASINPSMLHFKPEMTSTWLQTKESILSYITGSAEEGVVSDVTYGINNTEEANDWLSDAISYEGDLFSVDSETSGLFPRDGYVLGISACVDQETGVYISTECFNDQTESLLKTLLKKKTPILHNAKFDIPMFQYHFGSEIHDFHDTMLLHYVGNENPGTHGLKQLVMKYTKYGDYEKPLYEWIADFCREHNILRSQFCWEWIPFEVMVPYAAMDAVGTFQVFNSLSKLLDHPKLEKVYRKILIPGSKFLMSVQDNGVPFDPARVEMSEKYLQDNIDRAIEALNKNPAVQELEKSQDKEFNPNSTPQLRKLLFDHLNLTPTGIKTEKGLDSTNAEVLEELSTKHELPAHILNIRRLSKIKNTYLDKIKSNLDRDGRLRTNFNLHGTTSGRLSSSGKLNMQQIPRDNPIVKGCIKAKPGYKIVAMDLTTAEMYIAAVLSGDKALQNVFISGGDFHSTVAKKAFSLPCEVDSIKEYYPEKRQMAKAISFGILYGAQAPKISAEITKNTGTFFSPAEAQEVINDYFKAFPDLKKWIEKTKKTIITNGYVYSFFGRKRRLPNVKSTDNGIKSHAVRSGLNFVVQSPASDINLLSAIDVQDYIDSNKINARIFALVHDSILAEVAENDIDTYISVLTQMVQMDRGLSIPGSPIGIDIEVGEDYSFGKFQKYFENVDD